VSEKKKKRKGGGGAEPKAKAAPVAEKAAEKAPVAEKPPVAEEANAAPAAVEEAAHHDEHADHAPARPDDHAGHDDHAPVAVAASRPIPKSDLFGMMGYFTTPADLYHACEELRDAGYTSFDAHTPFPVHGLEKAMGLPRNKFPLMVFGGGIAGLSGAIALAYYTQAVWYPQNISGKQPFSYQAYIPIFFELTVLLAGLTCFFGLWAWLRLPTPFHPTFQHPSFHRHSDDLFFVSVEATDPKYDREKTKAMLEKLGVKELQEVRS